MALLLPVPQYAIAMVYIPDLDSTFSSEPETYMTGYRYKLGFMNTELLLLLSMELFFISFFVF